MRNLPTNLTRTVVLLAALALIACMGPVKQQRLNISKIQRPELEQIVGLTTIQGEDIQFDASGGVYVNRSIQGKVKGADYQIAIDQVQRLWVMRRGVSTGRTVALVVGITAAAAVVAGVTVLAVAASQGGIGGCPFVYAWDGHQFVFDGELYGGAISQGLERPDYSELPHLRAEKGAYRILLSNELEETDFTDSLELWTVDHPAGTQVGMDNDGRIYSLGDLKPPLDARDETGADLRVWLGAPDRRIWEPAPADSPDGRLRHEIVMSFAKPAEAQTAKLLVHAGTGEWGIRMLSTLYELYGNDIDTRMAELDRSPAEAQAIREWSTREDLYTLRVWVEEPSGWQMRGIIPGGGMGARVVPLDVSHVPGNRLRIRLLPPAGFWAINSVAVDYSLPLPLKVTRVAPIKALSQAGESVAHELAQADGVYYKAAQGESAEVIFPAPQEAAGMSRTVFLASKGYYRPSVRAPGTADAATLFQIFAVPDGMARFAAQRYAEWRAALAQ